MRAKLSIALGAALLVGVLLLPGPTAASAQACSPVTVGRGTWIVGGDGVGCRFIRHWSRSMLTGNGQPRGWHCHESGRGLYRGGGCSKGPNGTSPFFIYYPPD